MANWSAVVDFISNNYKYEQIGEGLLKLVFEVDDLRSQLVFLDHQVLNGGKEDWVVIHSPIGPVADVDLSKALDLIGERVVGGLSRLADLVTVKDALPIADLHIDELVRPMMLVTLTADDLEKALLGTDGHVPGSGVISGW